LLARYLRKHIVDYLDSLKELNTEEIMKSYNEALYLSGQTVRMKQNDELFDTSIVKVSQEGQLITKDAVERKFNFGEVEWVVAP
jgi:BirA family biotin operon repressor/biotin-[acetyl-CoA-carboxylase] ligase